VHGPAALADIASCTSCHGAAYDGGGVAAKNCNACHANPASYGLTGYAGSPSWKTDCTFCHGSTTRLADATFPLVGNPAKRANVAGPPTAPGGATSGVAVGAHLAHYDGTANVLSTPVICTQCHGAALPTDLAHLTGTVAVAWGALATAGGAVSPTPASGTIPAGWESSPTCTNYCHGATLAGGTLKSPGWTAGATASTCSACHGDPMPYAAMSGGRGFHPPNATCASCHTGYTASAVQKATHVNGTVEVVTLSCHTCHGDATSDAPGPGPDTTGGSAVARVGAHQAHTQGRIYSAGFGGNASCGECHGFAPTSVRHANARTEIGWVGIVTTAGTRTINGSTASPTYITPGAAATCANYCHGATLPGGAADKSVSWSGGPSAVARGSCHFIASPPAPHPAIDTFKAPITSATQCSQCHPATVKPDGTIDMAGGKHVNGQLDGGGGHAADYSNPAVHGPAALADIASCTSCHGAAYDGNGNAAMNCNACHANPAGNGLPTYTGSLDWQHDCTFCHGDALRAPDSSFPLVGGALVAVNENLAGPPLAPGGVSTGVDVGAHLAHFDAASNALSTPFQCSQCHGTTTPSDLAHITGTVATGWGAVATAGNTSPTPATFTVGWEASPTCTNYCHGATLAGGTLKNPSWTDSTGAAVACTACHGDPMPYAAMSGGRGFHPPNATCGSCHPGSTSSAPAKATHVNGTVEKIALTCHSCHGSAASDAPPTDTTGASIAARVGAHQAHVAGRIFSDGLGGNTSCSQCHGTLPTVPTHANGVVNIGWGSIATTNFATPTPTVTSVTPGSAITCTNFCHNVKTVSGGSTGGTKASITWTETLSACNSCHAIPSSGGRHTSVNEHETACSVCHPASYSSTTVDPALHVNGVRNVTATGWNATSRSCGNNGSGCHGTGSKGPW
jgi:predicted CxxxxCH...CXXCH cytochrome family protein